MVDRLRGRAVGLIEQIIIHRQNGRYLPESQLKNTIGQEIVGIDRVGKYICFHLKGGDRLVSHNAMSGFWDTADNPWTFDYVEGKREADGKHMRVSIHLQDGTALCFHDSRLFGSLRLFKKGDKTPFEDLGPDAGEMGPAMFYDIVTNDERSIKEVLMDQSRMAGIGNIYSTEALWLSRIDPSRKASEISREEAYNLWGSIISVFGTSLKKKLNYDWLQVYRAKKCSRCSSNIKKKQISKRSTYFCETCQK